MPIKHKLAETALLLYRVTDVPFLPEIGKDMEENIGYVNEIHQAGNCDIVVSIKGALK